MRYLLICLSLLMLCGCGGPMQVLRGPEASVNVDGGGGVHGHVESHLGQALMASLPPYLEYQDRYGHWQIVSGSYIEIPDDRSDISLRLRLNGRTVDAAGNYDGNDFYIGPDCWCFTLHNYRDGGQHPLFIKLKYHNFGQDPKRYGTPDTMPYMVINTAGY